MPVSGPTAAVESERGNVKKSLQDDEKMIAVVSYITIVGWIVAYIMHSKSDEKTSLAAFHLRQSAGLICFSYILAAVMVALITIVPMASAIGGIVMTLASLATTAHWIYGVVSAARGEEDYFISSLGDAFDGMFPWID